MLAVYSSLKSEVTILNGDFITESIRQGITPTFEEYADSFLSHKLHHDRDVSRLGIVWDIYKKDSIKYLLERNEGV